MAHVATNSTEGGDRLNHSAAALLIDGFGHLTHDGLAAFAFNGVPGWALHLAIHGLSLCFPDRAADRVTAIAVTGFPDRALNGVALFLFAGFEDGLRNGVLFFAESGFVNGAIAGLGDVFVGGVVHGAADGVWDRLLDCVVDRPVAGLTFDFASGVTSRRLAGRHRAALIAGGTAVAGVGGESRPRSRNENQSSDDPRDRF